MGRECRAGALIGKEPQRPQKEELRASAGRGCKGSQGEGPGKQVPGDKKRTGWAGEEQNSEKSGAP